MSKYGFLDRCKETGNTLITIFEHVDYSDIESMGKYIDTVLISTKDEDNYCFDNGIIPMERWYGL